MTGLVIAAAAHPLDAQQQAADVRQLEGARQFVHAFYDWYVPLANEASRGPTASRALREHPELFSPGLRRLLAADFAAQRAAPGESVGIDFDPFLSGQDPCAHYRIWNPTKDIPISWRFMVAGDCGGSQEFPTVTILVALEDGRWVIRDFSYPGTRMVSLRDELTALARERAAAKP